MAREATLLKQTHIPVPFTCADGTGIEKGAILTLSDPNTAATSSTDDPLIAGICAIEKIASNGITQVSVHEGGDFKVTISGSVAIGDGLAVQADCLSNVVYAYKNNTYLSGSRGFGWAKEAGSDTNTIRAKLQPHVISYGIDA